jgi:hypothetical protein
MTSTANLAAFTLSRDAFGKLVYRGQDGVAHVGVAPVRAFPVSAPEDGLSLVDADGHELLWVPDLNRVNQTERQLIEEELRSREFMPEINAIVSVSTFSTPSTWTVDTNRGRVSFILKGEEDIRRLVGATLLIADAHGIQFLIRDKFSLDKASRKLLDRFL